MPKLLDLELALWDCQAMQGEDGVRAVAELLAANGLVPGIGVRGGGRRPQPATDPAAYLVGLHHVTPEGLRERAGGRISDSETAEDWGCGLVRLDEADGVITLGVSRRGRNIWDISLGLGTWSYANSRMSLEAFVASWGNLLERLGDTLCERFQPVLGAILAYADVPPLESAIARRKLVVGWRTWFGSAYLDAFGRELLLGLPDQADETSMGVAHRLDTAALKLVQGDPDVYRSVRAYVEGMGVDPAWPRASRARRGTNQAAIDRALTQYRSELIELLSLTAVLNGNQRVKIFAPDWSELSDPQLGAPKRAVLVHSVREAAERELREHANAKIRFELGEDAPDELRHLLDELSTANPRLSYIVLPSEN